MVTEVGDPSQPGHLTGSATRTARESTGYAERDPEVLAVRSA
jgi:hypothetical protein